MINWDDIINKEFGYLTILGQDEDYITPKGAENLLGINHSLIARCCNGKVHTAGGYIWKYKDEVDNEQN